MLGYSQWKKLNESFAGAIPLGVSSPNSLGVRGGIEGTRIALEEARKKSKKYADVDVEGDVEDDEGGEVMNPEKDQEGGCAFCGKNSKKGSAKKSVKRSKKYMGADMDLGGGDDFEAGPPPPHHKLGKGKPFGKGKPPLHPDALGGDDDDLGGELGGDDDDLGGDLGGGDDDLGGDLGGGDDDLGGDDMDMGMGGDDDLGGPPPGHPDHHHPGGPLNKHSAMHKKPPFHPGKGGDLDMKMGAFMRKKMAKRMKKEAFLHNDKEWLASVKSMLTPQNVKYGDGWTEYQEEALLPPSDPNAGVTQREPQPGEPGFAPVGRVGPPLGGNAVDGFNEWRRQNRKR